MPLNLDSCITGLFVPGNIGASSGQPPVVRVMPPRVPDTFEVQVHEVTTATAVASVLGDTAAIVMETAAAVDAVHFAQVFVEAMGEPAFATDAVSVRELGVFDADLAEAATAADEVDGSVDVEISGMLGGGLFPVMVSPSGRRQANLAGVMVNL